VDSGPVIGTPNSEPGLDFTEAPALRSDGEPGMAAAREKYAGESAAIGAASAPAWPSFSDCGGLCGAQFRRVSSHQHQSTRSHPHPRHLRIPSTANNSLICFLHAFNGARSCCSLGAHLRLTFQVAAPASLLACLPECSHGTRYGASVQWRRSRARFSVGVEQALRAGQDKASIILATHRAHCIRGST
jgi:hypothetical protein